MAEAMIAEDYFTADAVLRYKYEQREKFLRDQRSREEYARAEGREEGRAEGCEETEERYSKLVGILSAAKRYDDLDRISKDKVYLHKLMDELVPLDAKV